jgi:hypothetical protein
VTHTPASGTAPSIRRPTREICNGGCDMKRTPWLPLAAALVLTIGAVGAVSATGADKMMGRGVKGPVTFAFAAVVSQSGQAAGRFDSNLVVSQVGVPIRGNVTCGWVRGNIGVIGGLMDGADPRFATSYFTVMVSDGPDGIIFGNGQPQCGTYGFGVPSSLPISAGQIMVVDN